MAERNPNPLKVLEGSKMSAVVFVQDYVQLQFDGPGLTVLTQSKVTFLERCFEWGKSGYRDALCDQIGKLVRLAVSIPEQEIKIEFETGALLSISLKSEDYRGAEAAVFDNPPNPTVVWQ
ncbi:MAG: hypothetical protein JWM16_1552 [Verrucomicrobiales bacterium]|nr:hypothetical protein [Verrucomicrobiales bacterium]